MTINNVSKLLIITTSIKKRCSTNVHVYEMTSRMIKDNGMLHFDACVFRIIRNAHRT